MLKRVLDIVTRGPEIIGESTEQGRFSGISDLKGSGYFSKKTGVAAKRKLVFYFQPTSRIDEYVQNLADKTKNVQVNFLFNFESGSGRNSAR